MSFPSAVPYYPKVFQGLQLVRNSVITSRSAPSKKRHVRLLIKAVLEVLEQSAAGRLLVVKASQPMSEEG